MVTRNYIKMCRKAGEVQKLWIPGLGDICINKTDDEEVMIVASRGKIADKEYKFVYMGIGGREQPDYWHKKVELILLPTQSQLQVMVYAICDYHRINLIHEFVGMDAFEYGHDAWCEFINEASMEEIWLTFLMYKEYNKIWDGKDWIKK